MFGPSDHGAAWRDDDAPFAALRHSLLPSVLAARQRLGQTGTLRIWSAACGSGERSYAVAQVVLDALRGAPSADVRILGTDIRRAAIDAAWRGEYGPYVVGPALRAVVEFRQLDLAASLVDLGPFDLIFTGDVLSRFAPPVRRVVAARVAQRLLPHGYLVVGGAEVPSSLARD